MKQIPANPACKSCGGSGVVVQSVPYGSTSANWCIECDDCVLWAIQKGILSEEEAETGEFEFTASDEPPWAHEDVDGWPGGIDDIPCDWEER